ncbi:MAG: alpha/beta hydrolase [Paracoccus sp. (in: a-proteobacteria)]|nr:alpha/beta hydrolase [Paracoccus sp. (in: a-proteobacteria)]
MSIDFFHGGDGARLAYCDEGEGLALLCLSGLTRTMADFDYVAPYLDGCRVIRMDYRGRGQSEWTGRASYTVAQEAQDAVALLDHLGIARAAILGTSRGGLIGLVMARRLRERMLGLCLNDIGPVIEQPGLERIFKYLGRNPSASSLEAVAEAMGQVSIGFSDVPPTRWMEDAQRHFMMQNGRIVNNYDPELREAFMSDFSGDVRALWPEWEATSGMPVALIRGANSDLLSSEVAAEMARRRPDMIFADVPGRGHIPWLDEPESVAVIHEWIQAVRSSRSH